jgi:hypothetical protein
VDVAVIEERIQMSLALASDGALFIPKKEVLDGSMVGAVSPWSSLMFGVLAAACSGSWTKHTGQSWNKYVHFGVIIQCIVCLNF